MNKPAIFCWGRFQPPHLGHEELINYTVKLAKEWNGQAYLFASATDNEFDDPKKRKTYNGAERRGTLNELRLKKNENPLKWKDKHHILTLMFGKKFPSLKIISIRNVVDIPSLLRKRFHHRNLILVVGRDRYDKLEGLMRQKGVHVIGKPRSKITSGTDIRKSALQGNLNTVHSLLGKNISRKKAEHIVDLIKKNSYFAEKGYPGQGGRRTRRKRRRSRKKRGGRRRRKTHKKRRKKRTRRRRSRIMSGGRPQWMPKKLGGVTLPRGRGKAEISDFIAFGKKLRIKKDLRPGEKGKFLFGPQGANEKVKDPHFHGDRGWIGWTHKTGQSTLVINGEYNPSLPDAEFPNWAKPVIAQIMNVFNRKEPKKGRATPRSGARTPPRGPTRNEEDRKGKKVKTKKKAPELADALRRLELKTANPWKIRDKKESISRASTNPFAALDDDDDDNSTSSSDETGGGRRKTRRRH